MSPTRFDTKPTSYQGGQDDTRVTGLNGVTERLCVYFSTYTYISVFIHYVS